jgi:cystathionine beta-lyase/cystathionine gamma-synthase
MSIEAGREQVAVPCFESPDQLRAGLLARAAFDAIDLYPRDGSERLAKTEAAVAEIAGVESNSVVLFNSGMSAITTAVEVALAASENPKPVLACAEQMYGQTCGYVEGWLVKRGVRVVRFDSGSTDHINSVLEKHQPDVFVSETIGNGPDMPVIDIDNLLKTTRDQEKPPVLVLDNTLPLSTALPLSDRLTPKDKTIVVESGTKSYSFNTELSGIAYTKNSDLVHKLKGHRRMTGSMPGLSSLKNIANLLPSSKEFFDERNRRIYQNTGRLAVALSDITHAASDILVSHPSLPTHDNYEFAKETKLDHASPVLFLQCTGNTSQFELTRTLWQSEGVRKHAKLGQSFGFDHARIFPDETAPAVRVAPGAYSDIENLARELRTTLQS